MRKIIFFFYIIVFACIFAASAYAKPNYEISISGIQGDLLKNVNSRLAVETANLDENLTEEDVAHFKERLPEIVKTAMAPFGYFNPTIKIRLQHKGKGWLVSINIKKDSPVRVSAVSVIIQGDGKENKEIKAYLQHLPIKKGDKFRVDSYNKIKEDLFKIANAQGYIKAYLQENKVLIDRERGEARIELSFHTGARYYFGKVTFENGPYSEAFLKRFINFNEKTPFSSEYLVTLQQDMVGSYYFDQVTITPEFSKATNHRVPIQIAINAPKAKKYSIGIGYGTFTGPRLTAGMTIRRIGDTGQHLNAQLKLSQVLSVIGAKYYIPGKNPLTDQWIFGANYQNFEPQNGRSKSVTVSGGYLRKIDNLQMSANLNYLLDRYKITNNGSEDSHFSKLLYPNLNFSYANTDDLLYPTIGKYFSLNLQGASAKILSSVDFMQAEAKAKFLFSPTSFSKIILRGDIGYTITDDIKQLPFSMRFFAGGLNSVRGYADSSLGPGRYLVVGSIEYQNHLYGNWDGALFYDVGNAMDHWGTRLARGEGFGVIYRSLIGPVKLYVGQAMNKAGKPHSIEFSIGPEF